MSSGIELLAFYPAQIARLTLFDGVYIADSSGDDTYVLLHVHTVLAKSPS